MIKRVNLAWKRAQEAADDFYLDSVALNLHSFYTALERVFELIAAEIDQSRPHGENWHRALLQQMALEIPPRRSLCSRRITRVGPVMPRC